MERFSNLLLKLELEVKELSGKHALVTGGNEGIYISLLFYNVY